MYQKVCFAALLVILIISSNTLAQIGAAVDPTFVPAISKSSDSTFYSTIQPDGKIIVSGNFFVANGKVAPKVVRLNTDGSLDNTFNCTACDFNAILTIVQPDGKILVSGSGDVNQIAKAKIIRVNSNGSLDNTFNFQPTPYFNSSYALVEVDSGGR